MTNLTYCPDDGAEVELLGIDGTELFNDDGSPMTITVYGADSDIGVKTRNAQQTRRFQSMGRVPITGDSQEADAVSYLVKMTKGWNITPSALVPGVDPGLGEGKVSFSPAAATALYKNAKLSIHREKVDSAIVERTRFMKPSPNS